MKTLEHNLWHLELIKSLDLAQIDLILPSLKSIEQCSIIKLHAFPMCKRELKKMLDSSNKGHVTSQNLVSGFNGAMLLDELQEPSQSHGHGFSSFL